MLKELKESMDKELSQQVITHDYTQQVNNMKISLKEPILELKNTLEGFNSRFK